MIGVSNIGLMQHSSIAAGYRLACLTPSDLASQAKR